MRPVSRPTPLVLLGLLTVASACSDQADPKSPGGGQPPDEEVAPGDDGADPGDDGGTGVDSGDGGTGDGGDDGSYTGDEETPVLDSDGDGLPDVYEEFIGTEVDNTNSDGDALSDYEEVIEHQSNPLMEDTDGDTLHDHEVLEENGGTNPLCRDSDGDGSPDAVDDEPLTPSGDGEVTPDPDTCTTVSELFQLHEDHDGDGITTYDELALYHTDPFNRDTDDDDLTDYQELFASTYGIGSDPEPFDIPAGLDPLDDDEDEDGLLDGEEVMETGTDPFQLSSDTDRLNDYDEVRVYGSDPWEPDTNFDGLKDDDAVDAGCDPTLTNSDADTLSDADEVHVWGTSCAKEDTDGGGMNDDLEIAYARAAGTDAVSNPGDDPATDEYVRVNEVWNCSSVSAVSVAETGATFDWSQLFYSDEMGTDTADLNTECVCDDAIWVVDVDGVDVDGITVWLEEELHTGFDPSGASSTRASWSAYSSYTWPWRDTPRPSAVQATTAWLPGGATALESDRGVATSFYQATASSTRARIWAAFYADRRLYDDFAGTGLQTTGEVRLRVSYANPENQGISDCTIMSYDATDGLGLKFRVDGELPAPPAHFLEPTDRASCSPGSVAQIPVGLFPARAGRHVAFPLRNASSLGGTTVQQLRVTEWRGASELEVGLPDGSTVTLRPTNDTLALGDHAPFVHDLSFRTTVPEEGPLLELQTSCNAPHARAPGHPAVDGYAMTTASVETVLHALGYGGLLTTMWPSLENTDVGVFRARLLVPEVFVEGPSQARLRIDVAGSGTLASLPIHPVLSPQLDAFTTPSDVTSWVIDQHSSSLTLRAALHQTDSGLNVAIERFAIAPDEETTGILAQPVTFALPAE